MLALRLQRTGRKGYALYRLVAQDAHRSPMSGKVAAYLGSYNPHAKTFTFDKTKVEFYLEHGAQPSPRVIGLLEGEGVKLPKWVVRAPVKKRETKKPDKLRKNRPPEAAAPAEPAEVEAAPDKAAEASPDDGENLADAVQKPEAEVAEAVTAEPAPEVEAAPEEAAPAADAEVANAPEVAEAAESLAEKAPAKADKS